MSLADRRRDLIGVKAVVDELYWPLLPEGLRLDAYSECGRVEVRASVDLPNGWVGYHVETLPSSAALSERSFTDAVHVAMRRIVTWATTPWGFMTGIQFPAVTAAEYLS